MGPPGLANKKAARLFAYLAERVGFGLSVIFRIPLRELAPCLAHYSAPKEKILNQRDFLAPIRLRDLIPSCGEVMRCSTHRTFAVA